MGLDLHSRDDVRGHFGGLDESTIRHVLSNFVVTVIDENNADLKCYLAIYVEKGFNDKGPIPFEGPDRLSTSYAKLRRSDEGWQISERWGQPVYKRDRG